MCLLLFTNQNNTNFKTRLLKRILLFKHSYIIVSLIPNYRQLAFQLFRILIIRMLFI